MVAVTQLTGDATAELGAFADPIRRWKHKQLQFLLARVDGATDVIEEVRELRGVDGVPEPERDVSNGLKPGTLPLSRRRSR